MEIKWIRKAYLFPVRFYKMHISPAICPQCIYEPSCSIFFIKAVERFGIIKGTFMGVLRILRCNRFFLGGPDDVPEEFSIKQVFSRFSVFRRHRKKRA